MRIGLIQAFSVMLPSGRFAASSSCNCGRPYGRSLVCSAVASPSPANSSAVCFTAQPPRGESDIVHELTTQDTSKAPHPQDRCSSPLTAVTEEQLTTTHIHASLSTIPAKHTAYRPDGPPRTKPIIEGQRTTTHDHAPLSTIPAKHISYRISTFPRQAPPSKNNAQTLMPTPR